MTSPESGSSHPIGDRRLVFTAGKGGVGRSTAAAAIAVDAARAGRKVLAVDVINDGGLQRALDEIVRADGLPSNLTVLELSPEESLREYIRLFLKIRIPPQRLGPISRIFDYVATAAPGVREVLTIGKIAHEVKTGPWGLVVVDGPATGHLVELLAAAANLKELIGTGPLADQTAWVDELVGDPAITGIIVVSLALELPMSEAVELIERIRTESDAAVSGLIVNRVPSEVGAAGRKEARKMDPATALGRAAEIVTERAEQAEIELDRAIDLDLPTLVVPDVDNPVEVTVQGLVEWEGLLEWDS